jgi:hypothetical protein
MRFAGVAIPKRAIITAAYVVLTSASTKAVTTCKGKVSVEDSADATQIANSTDLHTRTRIGAVSWTLPAWTIGECDSDTTTPSIVEGIQAIVNKSAWNSGYDINVFFGDLDDESSHTSNCYRVAYSYDTGTETQRPLLHIEYDDPPTTFVSVGSFAAKTSVGTQEITGVGFTPKAIILFATSQTANGLDRDVRWGFGASDGGVGQAIAGWSEDNLTGNDTDRYTAAKVIALFNFPLINEAELSSFTPDGFILNWTTIDISTAYLIHYIALGGTNPEVDVAEFDALNDETGNKSYTHVGFQPDVLFLFGQPLSWVGEESEYLIQCFGFVDGAGNQFAMSGASEFDYDPPTVTKRYQRTDKCFVALPSGGAPDHVESAAHWVSMDPTGFTLCWDTAAARHQKIVSVAIRGVRAKVGTTTAPGDASDVAVTGAGFKPRGALFAGFNHAVATTIQDNNRFSLGVADTARNVHSMFAGDTNNANPSDAKEGNWNVCCYENAEWNFGAPHSALVKTWGADGFTLTWSGTPGYYCTDQVGYLLLGDAVATLAVATSSGVASMAGVTVSTATPATIVAAATSGVASLSNVIIRSLSILAAAATSGAASVSNVAMTAASILAVAAVSGIASLPAVIVRSLSILAAAASGGVASVSNTLVGSLSILAAGATSGVATLPAVIVRSLSILAVAATSGVASVANVIISPILVAAAMNGLASLSGVAVAAPATVVAAAVSGVASLSNVIVKSLSILAAAATSGVASLSSVIVGSLSILAVAATSGVASLSSVIVGSLSILAVAATSGVASLSNVSLKAAAILAAASTSGVATAANVLLRAAAILSVVSVSGVASVPNTKVATRITLSVAATTGRASLPNVVLSSGSVVPAILTVAPSSGVATIPNIKVASLVRLTVATTSGVASLSNVTVRSLSILGVASMSGVASVSNVTVSAVFSPLTVAATNGTASMSNVAVTAPARLAIDATSGSASLPNVTVSAATVGELNLASMNGAASVANVSIQATAILGVASVSGVASIDNVILCSLSILAVGSTAGLASFPEVTITTGVTPLVVAATNGAASLSNLTVSSPSIFMIAPTSGVASVAGLDIVTGTTLLVGTVNGTASVANVSISAATTLAIGPSSGAASVPNVTVLAVTPGTLTVAAMSGIASLPNVSIGRAATVIDLSASYEHTTDLSASYEPDIDLEASYG